MNIVNASEAREKLYRLLDETATDHEPVLITGPRSNAVLVGEEDWNAIQESLHLLSVPGIRESVHSLAGYVLCGPRRKGRLRLFTLRG